MSGYNECGKQGYATLPAPSRLISYAPPDVPESIGVSQWTAANAIQE